MSKWHLWRKETLSLTSRFWLGLEWQREFCDDWIVPRNAPADHVG